MHWLYLFAAAICILVASRVGFWLALILVVLALALMLAWILGWLSSRVASGSRSETQLISPEELRLLREQAEARKAAAASTAAPAANPLSSDGESAS